MEDIFVDAQVNKIADSTRDNGVLKSIISGAIGNAVETTDWAIYGLAAPFIARSFFPKGDPLISLMEAYALFAIGYLSRPLGAIIFGPAGDKHGRTKVLSFAIIMMSLTSAAIALIPTYEKIGYLAPILVLLCRLGQGVAAGGEWGAASAFLYEFAPHNRKCFYSSWRPVGAGLGLFLGSSMLAIVASVLPAEAANAWGWRVPFLVVAVLGGIGLYIRLRIDETPSFKEARARNDLSQKPMQEMIASNKKAVLVMFGFLFIWNVVYFVVFYYLPSYLNSVLNVPSHVTLQTNSMATLAYTVLIPVVGLLCDKFGKKPFLLASAIGITVFSIPGFILLKSDSYISLLGVQLLFAVFLALYAGPATAIIAELFPARVRNTGISLTFNVHTALVAGTAPMLCVWLTKALGSPLSPAYYMILSSLLTLFSVLAMKNKGGKISIN